jgi:hypothetical protein
MYTYDIELTDTFAGEANYCWVQRATVQMPELTHYGYDGATNYAKANRIFNRELMRRAKAEMGLTGIRGRSCCMGDDLEFRPYGLSQVMFVTYREGE